MAFGDTAAGSGARTGARFKKKKEGVQPGGADCRRALGMFGNSGEYRFDTERKKNQASQSPEPGGEAK